MCVLQCVGMVASFRGLQSPNAVEGLVKFLRRMTSGRRTLDRRWVDMQLLTMYRPVKCGSLHSDLMRWTRAKNLKNDQNWGRGVEHLQGANSVRTRAHELLHNH